LQRRFVDITKEEWLGLYGRQYVRLEANKTKTRSLACLIDIAGGTIVGIASQPFPRKLPAPTVFEMDIGVGVTPVGGRPCQMPRPGSKARTGPSPASKGFRTQSAPITIATQMRATPMSFSQIESRREEEPKFSVEEICP